MHRRLLAVLAIIALAAAAASWISNDDRTPIHPAGGAPPRGGTSAAGLIPGGTDELHRRLDALRGWPVVVNQWASWCPPCRFEAPFFAQAAKRYKGEVAFLGVNSGDISTAAEDFLKANPTPYPHLEDPKADIARSFGGGRSWPTTAFYGPDGEVRHITPGAYPTVEGLLRDIEEHALGD